MPTTQPRTAQVNGLDAALNAKQANLTNSTTAKTTPVDADLIPLLDSAASFVLKNLSWANLKATLKTYFDTLYAGGSSGRSVTSLGTFTTTTSQALDWGLNVDFTAILSTGSNVTFTFSNLPTTSTKKQLEFAFRYTAGAFSFPATVSWSGMATAGSSYVFETGKDYIITFIAQGGTNVAAIAAPFPGAIF